MGLVSDLHEGDVEATGLGCEASGVVQRVGPDVKDLKPGDRVLALGTDVLSTVFTTSALICARMADDLSFEDAATMPCVYSTVIFSLLELGQLDADQVSHIWYLSFPSVADSQTVLIHSGCGGVGIAAIQICQMKNAKASVSSASQSHQY